MPNNDEYIAESLRDLGLLTKSQIDVARSSSGGSGLIEALVKSGAVGEEDVSRALAAMNSMEFVDLEGAVVEKKIAELLTADDARRYQALPINVRDGVLIVALADPMAMQTMDDLTYKLQREIEFVCAAPKAIHKLLIKHYGSADEASNELLKTMGGVEGADIEAGEDGEGAGEGDAPVIKLVSMLLLEAHTNRASDIHIEPLEGKMRVRFRIDGVLQEMQSPPKRLHGAIVSRLKIMSRTMSIAEKRLPQDGRIQIRVGDKSLDLRVSTIPTVHGESVVMRILDKTSLLLGLPDLGFLSDDQAKFEQCINLPDGIILVTGPTGSGKTTTLYGCLNYMNKPDRKLITVEDPVEYQMTGINQVPVNSSIGMTFPAALRSILRQAPNIIMIGEIRDHETASIAVNASLTGHLVLSTLHTNDAPSAIARLVDIGVKPFLVSSSVRAVVAQRLVRRLCPECKLPAELSEYELNSLQIDPKQLRNAKVMRPVGCENCRGKGYRGRMGIFELFLVDDEVRNMINNNASTIALRQRARELGMRTLREDGVRKVLAGMTTAEEVISTTMTDLD
ncbi:MAG: Flp pilus assembly complex ATPase component TadA [Verrucomicrobia bacterium]|nr:Flp pilus assembly complex ATPase component TadA [Verrucomicrobiota bacterium]